MNLNPINQAEFLVLEDPIEQKQLNSMMIIILGNLPISTYPSCKIKYFLINRKILNIIYKKEVTDI